MGPERRAGAHAAHHGDRARPQLLVVEDDERLARAFARVGAGDGAQVDVALTVDEALARLDRAPRVVAVIGPTSSTSAHRVALAAAAHGIAVVSASATAMEFDRSGEPLAPGVFFRTEPPDRTAMALPDGPVWVAARRALGGRERGTAALLHVSNEDGESFADVLFSALFDDGPLLLGPLAHYIDDFDYDDEALARRAGELLEGEPEVLYFGTLVADGARATHAIGKQLRSGYQPSLMGTWPHALPAFAAAADPAVIEGLVGTAPRQPASDPSLAAFTAAYRAAYGADPPLLCEGAYDAAYLIAYAMERAGAADRDAVRGGLRAVSGPPGRRVGPGQWAEGLAALRTTGNLDYDGAAGPIDWDENGDVTFARAPPSYAIYELHGGQIEIVDEVAAARPR